MKLNSKTTPIVWNEYKGTIEIQEGMDLDIDLFIPVNIAKADMIFDEDKYAQMYFLDYCIEDEYLKTINQSCKEVEDVVLNILGKDEWDDTDVIRMLAWKTGKIKHKDSYTKVKQSSNDFIVYDKSWDEGRKIQLPYQSQLKDKEKKDFIEFVKRKRKEYCALTEEAKKNTKIIGKIWNELLDHVENENKIVGLGTVYLITVLFFITNGTVPIYDRFAMASLTSRLFEEKTGISVNPGTIIKLKGLPGKDEKNNRQELIQNTNSTYNKYIAVLSHFFGKEWIHNRDIDRALWVYGHYFDVK